MSRAIKLGAEDINAVMEDIRKTLETAKLADGKFSYSTTIGKSDQKASVIFSPNAWDKMWALIDGFSSEVGWFGTARRSENEEDFTYIVDDILVYPQTVTGATVTFDETEVSDWMYENREDERFDYIHMHGHSHVNMGVSPSMTDKEHYRQTLAQIPANGFYLFMIWNKSRKSYCEIYDMKYNLLFEDSDITFVVDGIENLGDFMADAKKQVKEHKYVQYGNKPAEPKRDYPSAWEIQKAANAESLKKKAESKKSATQKRSGKTKFDDSYSSWDDYYGGYYGGIYEGCYGID